MKRDELQILNGVTTLQVDNQVLLRKSSTAQQRFFQNYAYLYLLRKNIMGPNIQQVLRQDRGSFTHLLLGIKYMFYLMDAKQEVEYEEFKILNMLAIWFEAFPMWQCTKKVSLSQSVFGSQFLDQYEGHFEQIIVYINCIANDVVKLLKPRSESSDTNEQYLQGFSHLSSNDLLDFASAITPKLYFYVIMPQIPPSKSEDKNRKVEYLYINQSLEYFSGSFKKYMMLLRLVLRTLLQMELKAGQLKQLMELTIKYFLLFFSERQSEVVEIFLAVFERTNDAIRYAMGDQLILFFKIARKLNFNEFLKFLSDKFVWVSTILEKMNSTSLIGIPRDMIKPFNPMGVTNIVKVAHGSTEFRTLEIFQENSLIYFNIRVESLDVNIRIYYQGQFQSKKQVHKLLQSMEKQTGVYMNSFIGLKKGIYLFEFDNSYSWINGKTIHYEAVVLAPYDLSGADYPEWLNVLNEQTVPIKQEEEDKQSSSEKQGQKGNKVKEPKKKKSESQSKQEKSESLDNEEDQEKEKKQKNHQHQNDQENQKKPVNKSNKKVTKKTIKKKPVQEQPLNQKPIAEVPVEQKPIKQQSQIVPKIETISKKQQTSPQQDQEIKPDNASKTATIKSSKTLSQKNIPSEDKIQSPPEVKIVTKKQVSAQVVKQDDKTTMKPALKAKKAKKAEIEQGQYQVESGDEEVQDAAPEFVNQITIVRNQIFFVMSVKRADKLYELETNLEPSLLKRIRQKVKSPTKYNWKIDRKSSDWLKTKNFTLQTNNKSNKVAKQSVEENEQQES